MQNFKLDYRLFDGEGGGVGEASAALDAMIGAEQGPKSKEDVSKVQYGKSLEDDGPAGQVGTDTGGQEEDLTAQWKAMTGKGGMFHDLYGKDISNAIQDRFKNQKDLQGQVDKIADDLSPLFMNYGLKPGDFDGLKNAIASDSEFYKAGAERLGIDVEQYKQNLKLQADAERGRQITEAYEAQQRQNEMFERWESEAAQLQQTFPNFDLALEIEHNERFARQLDSGVDVITAFVSTHLPEILSGSNEIAARSATQNVLSAIQQRASRPAESAVRHSPAIQRKSDPSTLTNDDMDEIFRRVSEGESFSF